MGNRLGKKQCEDPCQKKLNELFNVISSKKNYILRNDLKNNWSSQIDEELYATLECYLFRENTYELSRENFKKLYLDVLKRGIEQKVIVFFEFLGGENQVHGMKIHKLVTSIIQSVLIILKAKATKRYYSWSSKTASPNCLESAKAYSYFFLTQTLKHPDEIFTELELRTLLIYLDLYILLIFGRLYDIEDKHFYKNLLPKWKYGPVDSGKKLEDVSLLDMYKVLFLNYEIPFDCQFEWRILFSTSVHGESFSKLSGEIINKGATLIIVKDTDGYIFGGFAPYSWTLGPTFYGDNSSFLFTLYPKVNLYLASTYNDNFQYMNVGQQTMPNGIGMGGKLDYFGMWLSAEFGKGYCSESCTTYRHYKMMSCCKEFEISHLEVWGVGAPPLTPAELGERSVLDGNLEAKAILEMAGKTAYSEGLREKANN